MDTQPPRRGPRIGLIALATLALMVLVFWILRDDAPSLAQDPALASTASKSASVPASNAPLAAPDSLGATARSSVANDAPRIETAPETAAEPDVVAAEQPDLEARDWLSLHIVDERAAPIFDALVTIRGLRKEGDRGSWYDMRGGETQVRSDRDGRARIDYTRWVDIDGKCDRVDLVVAHPEFISFSESSFVLASGENTIELKQGAMVWLSAWHGSPPRVVGDVSIEVEWEAELAQSGWTAERDGRWSTLRLAPGLHWVTVTHESPELGKLASDFTPFELGEHARLDLQLELKPLVSLSGRLDDSIPRPIAGGRVRLNLHASDGGVGLSSNHETRVDADGTFRFDGLRSASGQVIAICDGWVSTLVPPRTLEQSRTYVSSLATESERIAALERARETERIAQPLDVAGGASLVIEMEPTGALEVLVVDEHGSPLAAATLSASPNVHWHGVGAEIFPWNDWEALTDANGLARIADLPPDESLWFGARSSRHQLRKEDRDESPSVVIESGKLTRAELVLERIP
jgi:hypothetical protein